jgi:adenylate cyclase
MLVSHAGIQSSDYFAAVTRAIERVSYTVMGDGVNVTARLEGLNKEMGTWICVSHNVYREAGHLLCLRPVDAVRVKEGRKGELLMYELLGTRGRFGDRCEYRAACVVRSAQGSVC